jgi:hypothetical protein
VPIAFLKGHQLSFPESDIDEIVKIYFNYYRRKAYRETTGQEDSWSSYETVPSKNGSIATDYFWIGCSLISCTFSSRWRTELSPIRCEKPKRRFAATH